MTGASRYDSSTRRTSAGSSGPTAAARRSSSTSAAVSAEVLAERAELVAKLRRLGPAWGEVGAVLNELKGVLGP